MTLIYTWDNLAGLDSNTTSLTTVLLALKCWHRDLKSLLGGLKIYVQIPFLGFDWVGLGFVETQPLNSSKLHRWYVPNSNNQDISLLKRGSGGGAYIWKEMGRTRRLPELDSAFKALKCPVPVTHCWHSECVTWEAPNVDDPISNITWKSQSQCLVLSASLNMALDGESSRRAQSSTLRYQGSRSYKTFWIIYSFWSMSHRQNSLVLEFSEEVYI